MQNFNSEKISIIIVTFRSGRYLEKCIASLYNFERKEKFEIIIVNNGTKDNINNVKNLYPEITILNNDNKGFAQAVNIGVKKAKGDLLFFLNPDTELVESLFDKVKKEFELDIKISAISPRVIEKNDKNQEWVFGNKLTLLQLIKNNLFGDLEKDFSEKKNVDWISGASMFIRKEDFLSIGGFDDNFFLYFEDIDLCSRLKKNGRKIVYLPEVKIKHFGSGSKIEKKERKEKYYNSQDYYFKKHFGFFKYSLVKGIRKVLK